MKSLKVEIGDSVKEGQLIAEIDSASIETQIEIAEAELANLEAQMIDKSAQVVLASANLTRQRALVAGTAPPSRRSMRRWRPLRQRKPMWIR